MNHQIVKEKLEKMAEMVQTKSVIHNKLMLFIAIVGLLMESEYEV